MRTTGNVLGAGDPNQDGLSLPMEEREDRHEARARHEAKRGRSSAPWANRPAPTVAETRAARANVTVDPVRERELFESKPLVVDQAPVVVDEAPVVVEPVVQLDHAPEIVAGPVIDEQPAPDLADTPAPAPVPLPVAAPKLARPRPPAKAPVRTARAHPPFDAAGIVQDYLAGKTVPEIAAARGHGVKRVRDLIRSTPGVEYRDGRKVSKKKTYDPAVVDAVRRLYLLEELSQAEVAARLNLGTQKVVQTIMARHNIPARPDVATSRTNHNRPGHSTIAHLREQIEAAGLTPGELRTWAREHGHDVAPGGLPSAKVLAAYVVAHRQPAPAPAVVDVPPVAMPTPEQPPLPPVAMPTPDLAVRRELTPEQQQAAEILGRVLSDFLRGFAEVVVAAAQEVVTALAASRSESQDDYTLAGGPE